MPDYRFRCDLPHADIQRDVRAAAAETSVDLVLFSAAGPYVWVQAREQSDEFVARLQAIARDGLVVDGREQDTPWRDR